MIQLQRTNSVVSNYSRRVLVSEKACSCSMKLQLTSIRSFDIRSLEAAFEVGAKGRLSGHWWKSARASNVR